MNPTPATPDSMDANELLRVRSLLPWYAKGQLDTSELAFMTHWLENNLAHHHEITAEIAWLKSCASVLQTQAREQSISADQGLAQVMQRIQKEHINTSASNKKSITFGKGLSSWLAQTFALRSPAMAFGMAAVLLTQAGIIGVLILNKPAEQFPLAGASGANTLAGKTLLTVAFNPNATEQAIAQALIRANATIVSGPSALSLYSVAVPSAQVTSATSLLRGAIGVVESVQP
jgi:hypothetical protein